MRTVISGLATSPKSKQYYYSASYWSTVLMDETAADRKAYGFLNDYKNAVVLSGTADGK